MVTYVHGWYKYYIPLFIKSVKLAYPEYEIRIFCNYKPKLNPDAEMYEFRNPHYKSNKPYYLRWLLPADAFSDLDYAFICDVDLLMLPEDPPMHTIRKEIISKIGKPYANFLRKSHPDYPERYTGWHFIQCKPYYDAIEPIIKPIIKNIHFDISQPPSYGYYNGFGEFQWGQEHLLYKILEEAFGVNPENEHEDKIPFANHHGIHLGPLRGGIDIKNISARLPYNDKFLSLIHI